MSASTDFKAVSRRIHCSPVLKARTAGFFYAITVMASLYGYFPGRGTDLGHVANLVSAAATIVVTVLLYELLKPVSRSLSLLMAFFNLEGIAHATDSLFYFGCFCILLGYLIFTSTFLPRALGVLMTLAGLGLLTNALAPLLAPAFAHAVSPYAFGLDGGEILLTLWLLAMGVNAEKWQSKANEA